MAQKKKGKTTKGKKTQSRPKTKEEIKKMQEQRHADKRVLDEIWAIVFIAIGVFLCVSIFTDGAGEFGHIIGTCLKGLFGFVANVLPFYFIIIGILMFAKQTVHINFRSLMLLFVIYLNIAAMNSYRFINETTTFDWSGFYTQGIELNSGGELGMVLGLSLFKVVGPSGLWIVTASVTVICLLLFINTPISRFFERTKEKSEERRILKEEKKAAKLEKNQKPAEIIIDTPKERKKEIAKEPEKKPILPLKKRKQNDNIDEYFDDDDLFGRGKMPKSGGFGLESPSVPIVGLGLDGGQAAATSGTSLGLHKEQEPPKEEPTEIKTISNKEAKEAMLSAEEINGAKVTSSYKKPPLSLLNKRKGALQGSSESDLKLKVRQLEETLRSFKVDAKVVQVTQGPTVTRFEIQPAVGVKVNSIVNLSNDIALNLRAKSLRIEAPIPGKAAVGIEIENDHSNMIVLRDIIDTPEFKEAKSKLSFAVGKDIGGAPIIADLKSMPHLLIAGATGSGKSVCINTIITSIIYKANPDEVKLILIDPKVVELGSYNGIPHLLIPVVTDPTKAAAALNWAVSEMLGRYKKFADAGVKDLDSYNEKQAKIEDGEKMSQVVIIIDELADLMMAAPSQVEESICRLAQMARAAGMHLIVATQRPSVNVITGVIKANIPSRIAFKVTSQVDSRTIIDMAGAEKLVGKGDMLFGPSGAGKPYRVQGCFVSDEEVKKVIEHVKNQVEETDFSQDLLSTLNAPTETTATSSNPDDELMPEAIEFVMKSGHASVSMLQRRFRIGYNRAARIIDAMEEQGIIGPADGSRPRQVLITEEEYQNNEDN